MPVITTGSLLGLGASVAGGGGARLGGKGMGVGGGRFFGGARGARATFIGTGFGGGGGGSARFGGSRARGGPPPLVCRGTRAPRRGGTPAGNRESPPAPRD